MKKERKADFTPEIRQAALRLIEIWRIMSNSRIYYVEKLQRIRERTCWRVPHSFDSDIIGSRLEDPVLDGICQQETIYERLAIIDEFNRLMEISWQNLTERDRYILDPYKRDDQDKLKLLCQRFQVSHSCIFIYRDVALKHLWNGFYHIKGNGHQLLYELVYQWRMLECVSHGRSAWRLQRSREFAIQTAISRTNIPIFYDECETDCNLPYLRMNPSWTISRNEALPDSLQIRLISQKKDRRAEKIVEKELVQCGYLFQIFRLRGDGKEVKHQTVYELPYDDSVTTSETKAA